MYTQLPTDIVSTIPVGSYSIHARGKSSSLGLVDKEAVMNILYSTANDRYPFTGCP